MLRRIAFLLLAFGPGTSHAFFFIFPIPNTAKPPALQSVIDALEKSKETRALAYTSEDKTFGSKYWVWGQFSGYVTQEEANKRALAACEASLANAKAQKAGGQPLYDFGDKKCELHEFSANNAPIPPTPAPLAPVVQPVPAQSTPPAPSVQPVPASSAPPAAPSNSGQPNAPNDQSIRPPAGSADKDSESPAMKKLKELKSLFDQGLITKDEYDEKRKSILDGI